MPRLPSNALLEKHRYKNTLRSCILRRLVSIGGFMDAVNHPAHYKTGGLEVIDCIEAWRLNYRTGNCVKYIARAGKKDPNKYLEDLKKARWYLEREIAKCESSAT